MRYQVFHRAAGWSWRLLSDNGRTLGQSFKPYRNRIDCLAAIELVMSANASTPILDESGRPVDTALGVAAPAR